MEARILKAALAAAVLLVSMGASYRTPNFVVETQSPQLAEQFAKAAEQYRRDLAIAWLGETMPDWSQPCVMTAQVGTNLGAGGATTFVFDRGQVFGWRMTIQGSHERILDSVLPHEITHMIFACRFRQPVPRWADEGGATSVEHPSERAKHYRMLIQFLQSNRGIAFNRMFAMEEYPRDIMPLYAQGYTLCDYLIQKSGRRQFVEFLGEALESDQWSATIQRHYGMGSVGGLQDAWLAWVRQGFPRIQAPTTAPGETPGPELLVAGQKRPRPEPNLIYRIGKPAGSGPAPGRLASVPGSDRRPSDRRSLAGIAPDSGALASSRVEAAGGVVAPAKVVPASGWHAVGESPGRASAAVAQGPGTVAGEPAAESVSTQVAHPQPVGMPRQIILEWSRP
ncbi:MAG TPA: hypothetical protein VMY37_12160 [Thermoguttaceae bacterium]|nr:hypothetical protein [Thermoguttaceae bacterium]